jgi:HAD superfamily hydrolase (TIGR01549 family)
LAASFYDTKPITTIVFDLDDTLRYSQPHAHQFACDFAETLLGRPLTPHERRVGQRWEHFYWASSDDLRADVNKYGEGNPEFWLNYSQRNLLSLGFLPEQAAKDAPKLNAYMREHFNPVSLIHPETVSALDELRRRGYQVGLLTNRPRPIHREMHEFALDLHMDFFLTASQLGAFKPSKEIFQKLLAFLGLSSEQVLYVGDNYYADIVGARNAGLQCLLLNWNNLYENPDCDQIKSVTDLLAIFELQAVK